MDAFEVNKTIGAVLSALLVMFASKTMLDIAYKEHKPEKPGWALPITEVAPTSKEPAAPSRLPRCSRCWRKPARTAARTPSRNACRAIRHRRAARTARGPISGASWDASPARTPGFPYSEAMKSKGGEWTWEALATYLHDPKTAIPGNKMAFPGIRDNAELADVLVYMRKLSDTPGALPQ